MQTRKGGAWRTTTSAQAYINGAWRQILYGKAYKGGAWRDVCNFTTPTPSPSPTPTPTPTPTPAPSLSISVSPTSIDTATADSIVVSDPVTATPLGGLSPYSYLWSIVSSDGHSFTITAPTSATTSVRCNLSVPGASASGSLQCSVTDSSGLSGTSATVPFTLTNTSPSGGGSLL